jgi:hypothetical protein
MDWIDYDREKWHNQPLPPENRMVLVQLSRRRVDGMEVAPGVAVGYLRYASGDPHSPHFIVPGIGGPVVAWCDSLGDDFQAPLWKMRQPENKTRKPNGTDRRTTAQAEHPGCQA